MVDFFMAVLVKYVIVTKIKNSAYSPIKALILGFRLGDHEYEHEKSHQSMIEDVDFTVVFY